MQTLKSWKEIAQHVGRGVRTVQRWERDLGLPVHRPAGNNRTAVFASTDEVEQWLHRTPTRAECPNAAVRDANDLNTSGPSHPPAPVAPRVSQPVPAPVESSRSAVRGVGR